ncbi:hypothetical protein TNCV_4921531 [Trichonephila clavipes]|nr:hypothetical protein TNCV_4921531 [Trichonephila clavipes]
MIKITASCDKWIMTKSVASVAAIGDYNHCHMPRQRIKEALDVSLEYSSPCGFHILPNLICCTSEWCIGWGGPIVVQAWTMRFRLTIDWE